MTGTETNFLERYFDKDTKTLKNVTATQFLEVWEHYDKDGNGYIEGHELESFIKEFVTTVADNEHGLHTNSGASEFLSNFTEEFMEAFDDNQDNRIEIGELASILPTEETFLLLFRRDNPLESSVEFMKVWKRFDVDCNGFIDKDELRNFLTDLLKQTKQGSVVEDAQIQEYTSIILNLFDRNSDGKLQLSEMARLLPIRENYLSRPLFKNANKLKSYDVERVFRHYDRNGNGYIEDIELDGFLKDLLQSIQEDYEENDITFMRQTILTQWDVNHDGKIDKSEMKMLLLQHSQSPIKS